MITLLIPTMNRTDFLIRLLNYYQSLGFEGYICITDSSDAEHVKKTKTALQSFQNLNIVYKEYPPINDVGGLQHLADLVTTPYVALLPDDDFLVPAGLEQCAMFLDSHPEYIAAHGVAIGLRVDPNEPDGIVWTGRYELPIIEGETASQRLREHMRNYTTSLFSVHRIDTWRKMYRDVSLLADKTFAWELLPCCLTVIEGKVKELDCFYLVRQAHERRYLLPGINDWMASPNWRTSYQTFSDCLAKELAQQDGVSIDEAQKVVEEAFSLYLSKALPKPSRLREVAGMIPGVRWVWRALHSLNLGQREEASLLAALLRPSSPYHADFMPIYRALTTVPAEPPEETS